MQRAPFEQTVIALVWDFDKTLISGYMQKPLFARYGVDADCFWREANALVPYYAEQGISANPDTVYLNHILTYVREGKLKGLSNAVLREMGAQMEFYPGVPSFFGEIKSEIEENPEFAKFGIKLEHYVVSTGFAETIKGSAIAPFVENIFGSEFIEAPAKPGFLEKGQPKPDGTNLFGEVEREVSQVAQALDNTSKTRYLFEINKGSNKFPDEIGVHSKIAADDRRVPFTNMIYIADGPSDVPAFSILNANGGSTYAVYPKGEPKAWQQVEDLHNDGRVKMYGEADYTQGSPTWMWLVKTATKIANRIATEREARIKNSASAPPRHL